MRGGTVSSFLTFVATDGAPFLCMNVFRARFGNEDTTAMDFTQSRVQQRTQNTSLRLFRWSDTSVVDANTLSAVTTAF